jgi:aminoglycoside phosphotransferase family enzyme/predicted kinase
VVETHISWVFLAGDRAYKVRKPVVMPFLDYSTLARRKNMAEEELRLGRRLAPELYLGVRPLFSTGSGLALDGRGDPVEYAVEMRRFSPDQTLDSGLTQGQVDGKLMRSLGARVANFHAAAPVRSGWGPEAVATAVDDNFATLLEVEAGPDLARQLHAGHRFAGSFLDHGREIFAARARTSVREGHGDLRAEHVVIGEQIEIFDPVEFDPALREIDVSADLAFLVMDLERHGRPDLAAELLSAYREEGGDPGDDRLVYFYATYRAWVRAKVAWLRARQHGLDATDLAEVARLAELGGLLAWRARCPLALVVCGPGASGKTYLARQLSRATGLAHLNSDVVRKALLGLSPEQPAPLEAYEDEWNHRTYGELGRRAAAELEAGGGVVVDATFRHRADREAFASAYGSPSAPVFVECRTPAAVIAARAKERTGERDQSSDADVSIALRQQETFEALDEVPPARHVALRTDRPVMAVIDELEAIFDERVLYGPKVLA